MLADTSSAKTFKKHIYFNELCVPSGAITTILFPSLPWVQQIRTSQVDPIGRKEEFAFRGNAFPTMRPAILCMAPAGERTFMQDEMSIPLRNNDRCQNQRH
jgi:hypothetical protein